MYSEHEAEVLFQFFTESAVEIDHCKFLKRPDKPIDLYHNVTSLWIGQISDEMFIYSSSLLLSTLLHTKQPAHNQLFSGFKCSSFISGYKDFIMVTNYNFTVQAYEFRQIII